MQSRWLTYFIGTLILSFGAFFNWFPFIAGDTAVYIDSGFQHYIPAERPIFYGWFLRFSSLSFSLWIPALLQSAILSYLLINTIEYLWKEVNQFQIILCLLLIGMGTGVWWESTKLIPDVFVSIMVLGLLLIMFRENSFKQKVILHLLIVFAAATHLSHLAVFLSFIAVIMLSNIYGLRTKLWKEFTVIGIGALVLVVFSNVVLEGKFQVAKGNTVFLLGKLNEAGLLDLYLEEHCPKEELLLCQYKDSFPATAWQFVWDPDGALMKLGGWESNHDEYVKIVGDILYSPKYWPIISFKAFVNTGVQIVQLKVGENLYRHEKESNVIQSIDRYYSHETNAALWTKQFLMELPFDQLSWFYLLSMMLCLLWLLWRLSNGDIAQGFIRFLILLAILLLLNAFFTANLGNISSRLNARLIWLLPAMALTEMLRSHFTKKASH